MLIKQLQVSSLLSYGPDAAPVALGPLNVLIGPNGSGKSNFLEALSLLQAAPDQITRPIRDGGGIQDWLHKTAAAGPKPDARIEALIVRDTPARGIRYGLAFHEVGGASQSATNFSKTNGPTPASPSLTFTTGGMAGGRC